MTLGSLAGSALRGGARAVAAARRAPALHPDGVHLAGALVPLPDAPDSPWSGSWLVPAARVSKGAGTPGAWPDVLGLAFRATDDDGLAWDLALSTTGRRSLTRCLPLPTRSWTGRPFGTLQPYAVNGRLTWLRATWWPPGDAPVPASLAAVRHQGEDALVFRLSLSSGDRWLELADLVLRVATLAERPAFDPMGRAAPGSRVAPAWLASARASAYAGSRRGRRGRRQGVGWRAS
jgi:hypothetical protein